MVRSGTTIAPYNVNILLAKALHVSGLCIGTRKTAEVNHSLLLVHGSEVGSKGLEKSDALAIGALRSHPSLSSTSFMLALVMTASSHLNHWSLCWRMKLV